MLWLIAATSLNELGHAGLAVRLWDNDIITEANLGRQRFAECEAGLYKSVALINRFNRWTGTNWKAETMKFGKDNLGRLPEHAQAAIYISCVDSVKARFEIAEILRELDDYRAFRNRAKYCMDFGNSQSTGQVILSTIGNISQPQSNKYETVANLPFITDEYGELLKWSEETDNTPNCSLAEALEKQDLYINSSLTQMGCSLLWGLFRNGMAENRGFFTTLTILSHHPTHKGRLSPPRAAQLLAQSRFLSISFHVIRFVQEAAGFYFLLFLFIRRHKRKQSNTCVQENLCRVNKKN